MLLSRVEIENFRSINSLTLDFNHRCQALIGINESGKSNILRALQLLDPAVTPNVSDLRIERHDEPQVTRGHVRFVFDLSAIEVDEVHMSMRMHFCADSIDEPLVVEGSESVPLRGWCESHAEGLYQVALLPVSRIANAFASRQSERLLPNWYRNKTNDVISLASDGGAPKVVPARGFIFVPKGSELSETTFEKPTLKDLDKLKADAVGKLVRANLPKCIFWKYADQYLLPSTIDVASFCASPDTCIPLKSMFELGGFDPSKLTDTIAAAQTQGHYRYLQILQKTAAAATNHIRGVWKDHKNIQIKLEPNGATLSPVIVDGVVPLDMANRSDGFKRLVSFLLQVSAKVRTNELQDTLILVDEPEIGLHPTGARSLMHELIAIGRSNYVVYSTHSIFMVDKSEIGRHLVVEKKNEVTTTWRAEKSRIQDEEVLYSAIGYSIFESLKEHNIIFEGWRDKEIFKVVSDAMSKSSKPTKDRLAEIGLTFADGVKDVKNVAHFLQLASRPCLIISDADKVAIQHRKAYQVPGAWGTWKTLHDVMPSASVVTGEDLLTKAAIVKRANKFRGSFENLSELTEASFDAGEAALAGLRRWLESSGLTGAPLEDALSLLKLAVFDGLKRSEISDQAEALVTFVLEYDFSK